MYCRDINFPSWKTRVVLVWRLQGRICRLHTGCDVSRAPNEDHFPVQSAQSVSRGFRAPMVCCIFFGSVNCVGAVRRGIVFKVCCVMVSEASFEGGRGAVAPPKEKEKKKKKEKREKREKKREKRKKERREL